MRPPGAVPALPALLPLAPCRGDAGPVGVAHTTSTTITSTHASRCALESNAASPAACATVSSLTGWPPLRIATYEPQGQPRACSHRSFGPGQIEGDLLVLPAVAPHQENRMALLADDAPRALHLRLALAGLRSALAGLRPTLLWPVSDRPVSAAAHTLPRPAPARTTSISLRSAADQVGAQLPQIGHLAGQRLQPRLSHRGPLAGPCGSA